MKSKLIFLYVFICVFSFGFATIGVSNNVDSTSLDDPVKLATSITKAKIGGIPVGTVITWAHAGMPEDPENWLECNGQAVIETKHPELYLMMKQVPDYRGKFLRSAGGKAAEIGESQESSVNIAAGDAIVKMGGKLSVVGGANSSFSSTGGDTHQNHGNGTSSSTKSGHYAITTGSYFFNSTSNRYGNKTTVRDTPYAYSNSGSTIDLPLTIQGQDDETRPENVTVRYFIRAQS